MRETQAEAFHPQAITSDNTSDNISSIDLLSSNESSRFVSGKESRSVNSLLPNLDLVENTASLTRSNRNDASGVGGEKTLDATQQRIADSIEMSILKGDLSTLQATMKQFAGRGKELMPILAQVEEDMRTHEVTINFSCDSKNQVRVRVGQHIGPYSLYLFTDPKEPMSADKIYVGEQDGRYYAKDVPTDPQKALKEITG